MEQENKQKKSYLSWDKAILSVLEEEGKSMHYRTIAERIIEHGLVKTSGATPANTVNAYLHGGKLSSKVTCVRRGEYILTDLFKQDPSLVVLPQSPGDVEDEESNVDDALITAYGRFWSRCIWEQNNKNLYGASSNTSNATGVDFTTCSGIYLLHKGYEVIYVGSPIYWGGMPEELFTALKGHDYNDKIIRPFTTHEGSGLSGVPRQLKEICVGAEVLDGLAIVGSSVNDSKKKVEDWI